VDCCSRLGWHEPAVAARAKSGGVQRVIGYMRLGTDGDIGDGMRQIRLGADCRIIAESQVWRDLAKLGINTQNSAGDAIVRRADICMQESIGQHAVDVAPEQFQLLVQCLVRHALAERQQ
jgi:hypothetical protein